MSRTHRLLTLFVVFAILAVVPVQARQGADVSSREIKMLLRLESFRNLEGGLEKFWDLVTKAAESQGLKVTTNGAFPGKEETRHVAFYDTADFRLYKLGYILRKRGEKPKDVRERKDKEKGKYELTLKFRDPELLLAIVQHVQPASGLNGEIKVEEDCVAGPASLKRLYSLSGTVACNGSVGEVLKDYFKTFPGLKNLKADEKAPIKQVRDVTVREYVIKPGTIFLDGATPAKVTCSVWWRNEEPNPCLVEFSFKYVFAASDRMGRQVYKTAQVCDNLIKAIQSAGKGWILDGGTKTGLVYQINAGNQE